MAGVESVVRAHFKAMRQLAATMALDEEKQRRVLLLSGRDWPNWSSFAEDGPLPPHPEPSLMLRRLGAATYRLASLSEKRR